MSRVVSSGFRKGILFLSCSILSTAEHQGTLSMCSGRPCCAFATSSVAVPRNIQMEAKQACKSRWQGYWRTRSISSGHSICLRSTSSSSPGSSRRGSDGSLGRRGPAAGERDKESQQAHSTGRLEYRHAFHAGNTADCFKHTLLMMMIKGMLRKDAPMTYVDTHSGAGMYDFETGDASQLREWERGILRIMDRNREGKGLTGVIKDFAASVAAWNDKRDGALRYYPGSPLIACQSMRPCDSVFTFERDTKIHAQLESALSSPPPDTHWPMVKPVLGDGFKLVSSYAQNLSSQRGLVFIDPAYQDGSDLERTVALAKQLRKSWRSARLAVWYPVRPELEDKVVRLHEQLREALPDVSILGATLTLPTEPGLEGRLGGNGMVFISPIYGIDDELRVCLDELGWLLTDGKGGHVAKVQWINVV